MNDRIGAVIMPAHNEAAVIGRTLGALHPLLRRGEIEVIVACNGCTDGTADIARAVAGVVVLEVEQSSKVAALNAADLAATGWPRLYLDADIEITPEAVSATLRRLAADPGLLAARPASRYELGDVGPVAAAYHRVRSRIPELHRHLWGAGAYALSQAGHARIGSFPAVTADDLWIDLQFGPHEKAVVDCPPVAVRPPRTARSLVHTLIRVYGGNRAIAPGSPVPASGTTIGWSDVARTVRGPRTLLDASVYLGVVAVGRVASRRRSLRWARDETSRQALPQGGAA